MRTAHLVGFAITVLAPVLRGQAGSWAEAEVRAKQSQRAIRFSRKYAEGWLAHADPRTGLLPRTTKGQLYWNAQDCAADNFPFILLTAWVTDNHHLKRAAQHILEQERKLTRRLDSLPDDFVFGLQGLRRREPRIPALIFGASEYAKDGLMPVTEWLGKGPWVSRMLEMIRDIWKHAPVESPAVGVGARIPSRNIEVNGELLQTMSRLYWLTGDAQLKDWCFLLADHHLFHQRLLDEKTLSLRDHGCEIIGGLSEALVIAAREDLPRHERYSVAFRAVLDFILAHGVNEDGMMPNRIAAQTGEAVGKGLSDGFGYVYDAFLTVARLEKDERYEKAVRHALERVHKYHCRDVPGMTGADGHADAIEGVLNLLNRLPVESAFRWVDEEIAFIFEQQKPDGIIEGWYGDGNSARTALMYAMWKTQGVCPAPWRDDVKCGATRDAQGRLRIFLQCDWAWSGRLRFDRPRHRDVLKLPLDYPRINQFPEWFTVEMDKRYRVRCQGRQPELVSGKELLNYELTLRAGETARFTVEPDPAAGSLRELRYTPRSAEASRAWQAEVRSRLLSLLKLDPPGTSDVGLAAKELRRTSEKRFTRLEVEFQSTAATRIRAVVTIPHGKGKHAAVVCVHGHAGNRRIVYDDREVYRRFASELAALGYVTISVDVGQHEVREKGCLLMGERLHDLFRCVDYLVASDVVDSARIGCAGLSLGGEMCMWLAALDPRVRATVSSGFLTTMDQMERNHCVCWKFDGLRELVDYADIYSLTAPRALQCQNGLREGPRSFCVPLARRAMRQIHLIYRDQHVAEQVELDVHDEGHVIDLPSLLVFFARHLR